MFLFVIWWIITVLQGFFGYGTAYRLTRDGGDNGVSLFGWLILMGLAALIPGLGFYLWHKSRDWDTGGTYHSSREKPKFMTNDDYADYDNNELKGGNSKKSNWKNPYEPE